MRNLPAPVLHAGTRSAFRTCFMLILECIFDTQSIPTSLARNLIGLLGTFASAHTQHLTVVQESLTVSVCSTV
jgi:hypothetical protein